MILAEFIDTRHSGCVITASETVDKLVCRVIITDCDHGIQVVIQGFFSVSCGKTVIIFIYSTHDIQLDQTGSLHLLIIDGTFGIFCKITYIYGPGTVISRKK